MTVAVCGGRQALVSGHLGGEVLEVDRVAGLREGDGALDLVLELAHVAGPGVAREAVARRRAEAGDVLPRRPAESVQEVAGEQGRVPLARAERRKADGED